MDKRRSLLILLILFFSISAAAAPMRDPTRPYNYQEKISREKIIVDSIIASKSRKLALINGKFVSIGDTIGESKIIAIDPLSVQFTGTNGNFSVLLNEQVVKKERKK